MDLTTHLRSAVRGCLSPSLSPAHTSSSIDDAEDKDTDQDRLGIAQSALMCLDILAKYLGSSPNWVVTLADTLAEVVTFSSEVVVSTQAADNLRTSTPTPISIPTTTPSKSKKSKKALVEMDAEVISPAAIATAKQSYPELLKLQGSVFLTAGTICGTVGPRGLPFLSVRQTGQTHITLYFMPDVFDLSFSFFSPRRDNAYYPYYLREIIITAYRILTLKCRIFDCQLYLAF